MNTEKKYTVYGTFTGSESHIRRWIGDEITSSNLVWLCSVSAVEAVVFLCISD